MQIADLQACSALCVCRSASLNPGQTSKLSFGSRPGKFVNQWFSMLLFTYPFTHLVSMPNHCTGRHFLTSFFKGSHPALVTHLLMQIQKCTPTKSYLYALSISNRWKTTHLPGFGSLRRFGDRWGPIFVNRYLRTNSILVKPKTKINKIKREIKTQT